MADEDTNEDALQSRGTNLQFCFWFSNRMFILMQCSVIDYEQCARGLRVSIAINLHTTMSITTIISS